MTSDLEDQIEAFTFEHFDASESAQRIFASFTESDVAKKLNEMSGVQQAIENVLKQEVKKNYASFLNATEQIQQVGEEMAEFRQLIQNTQKLIGDVRQNKISDSRAMRTNSLLPSIQFQKAAEELRMEHDRKTKPSSEEKTIDPKLLVPEWLGKTPDDLAEYIVEQQYQKAVALILKAKQYAEGPGAKANEKCQEILNQVSNLGSHLATTLKKSLLNLPNSPLWGMTEQYKRLKLLITLKEYAQASEGFALIKEQNMLKAVQSVETSTDIIYYAKELSRSFFQELYSSVSLYHTLFTDQHQNENSEIVMLLVQWTQGQMSHYVLTLSKQAILVVTESAMLWLIHLRDQGQWRITTNAATFSVGGSSYPSEEALRPTITPTKSGRSRPRRQSILIPQAAVALNSSSNAVNSGGNTTIVQSNGSNPSSSVVGLIAQDQPLGGLFLLSKIINAAFQHAHEYQDKQQIFCGDSGDNRSLSQSALNKALPMVSFLGFYIVPEINKMVAMYLEEFIREASSQVRQDSWSVIRAPSLVVTSLIPVELRSAQYYSGGYNNEDELVCLSYTWIVSGLDHLFADLSLLLNGDSNVANNFYRRTDISELEAVAAASLLRLLLRFIVELESIDVGTFSKVQQQCYANTLKATSQYLIPSMQRAMDNCFLPERLQLLSTTPSNVFKTASLRLNRLAQEANTNISY